MDGHYDFSFAAGRFPRPDAPRPSTRGSPWTRPRARSSSTSSPAPPPGAGPDPRPDQPLPRRLDLREGTRELMDIVGGLSGDGLAIRVPACPAGPSPTSSLTSPVWPRTRPRACSSAARSTPGARPTPPRPGTAGLLGTSPAVRLVSREQLLRDLGDHAGSSGRCGPGTLRRGRSRLGLGRHPLDDLAVHLADLREALALAPDEDGPVARWGLAAYRSWLAQRLEQTGSPALGPRHGIRRWQLGSGPPLRRPRNGPPTSCSG